MSNLVAVECGHVREQIEGDVQWRVGNEHRPGAEEPHLSGLRPQSDLEYSEAWICRGMAGGNTDCLVTCVQWGLLLAHLAVDTSPAA